ncbi:MAG: ArsR/SmtB family transcription factor [Pseudomonadales bacterium]
MARALASSTQRAPGGADLDQVVALGKAVGDRLRAGILQVLHQDSYAVGELCELFDVPQPALSHHLKILHQAGLVARRREGNSIFYRRAALPGDDPATTLLAALDQDPLSADLAARVGAIHRARNRRSAAFFDAHAEEISAHQAEICEPDAYGDLVMDMIDAALAEGLPARQALEVGPGTGELLGGLADRFASTVGVDNARPMLGAARAALANRPGVRLRYQDFMTLPRQRRYDAVVAAMVVHHQASPAAFFQQAAGVLRAPGTLVVVELCRHDQEWAADACGDQWLGFEPDELTGWAERAGFETVQSQYLTRKNGFRIQIHRFRPNDGASARQLRKNDS